MHTCKIIHHGIISIRAVAEAFFAIQSNSKTKCIVAPGWSGLLIRLVVYSERVFRACKSSLGQTESSAPYCQCEQTPF